MKQHKVSSKLATQKSVSDRNHLDRHVHQTSVHVTRATNHLPNALELATRVHVSNQTIYSSVTMIFAEPWISALVPQ